MDIPNGAIPSEVESTQITYDDEVIMGGTDTIDWEKGYDVRNEIGADIEIKYQGPSLSCVGQAWSYYVWVLNVLEALKVYNCNYEELEKNYPNLIEKISAKAVYCQIALELGGARIADGGKLIVNWGAVREHLVPSNRPDGSCDEQWMKDKSLITAELGKIAQALKGKNLRIIKAKDNLELFARAVRDNKGVVGGLSGKNNGTWLTERPVPPSSLAEVEWGHSIAYLAYGTDEKGRFIASPNSFGKMDFNRNYTWKPGDPPGAGWQKFYVDYFNSTVQFDPYTYTDLLNLNLDNMNNFVRIVKDKNSSAVGFFLPAYTPDTLTNMAALHGKTIYKKEDGSIDWDKTIEGQAEFDTPLEKE